MAELLRFCCGLVAGGGVLKAMFGFFNELQLMVVLYGVICYTLSEVFVAFKEGSMTNVLVVDDDHTVLSVIEACLKKNNFNVLTAENGDEALQIFNKHPVDCIFLDWEMPKMNGMAFMEVLLSRKLDKPFPKIIICTGNGTEDVVEYASNFGARYFIDKPVSEELIVGALAELGLMAVKS